MATLTNIAKNTATLTNQIKTLVLSYILKEDGGFILMEGSGSLLRESVGVINSTLTNVAKN